MARAGHYSSAQVHAGHGKHRRRAGHCDVALNDRYQLLGDADAKIAVAPR
jgi:hypothetical protein